MTTQPEANTGTSELGLVRDAADARTVGPKTRRRSFSFRPALTVRGRKFKGLRGFSGKPLHPPLTDIPIAAFLFTAVFDVVAAIGNHHGWASGFFHAGSYVLVGGVGVAILAALTGWWDRIRSSETGTQARRTINAHALIMTSSLAIASADLGLRLSWWSSMTTPSAAIIVLSVAMALVALPGATYGGSMVFDYGFNVETAGDHPVWHVNEKDVFPGQY
jgi:uncharacterized membrane protein